MKDNLENAFRNSLQDYEAPYDPKAWEAVSSKLGAQPTAVTGGTSSVFKWVLASVLVGAVATGAFFLFDHPTDVNTAEHSTEPIENNSVKAPMDNEFVPNTEEGSDEEVIVPVKETNTEEQPSNQIEHSTVEGEKEKTKARNNNQSTKEVVFVPTENNKEEAQIAQEDPKVVEEKFVAGYISSAMVCEGESATVSNTDNKAKVKFKFAEEWIVIQPGKSVTIDPSLQDELTFVNGNGEVIEKTFVKVQGLPSANFTYEANIYEGGLPVVICEAYGDYASYEWTFDDELKRSSVEVKHHFFEKGNYDVALKVVDRNGCENTSMKTIRIRDKYNLMAVDAFKPNGSDIRNRTFMPYSLTERNVKFQLTIVDPIDNSVVFTSSDARNAWDGTDQKTGKMTPSNKAYMWKVQILDPLPNERPIYAGTIVHN